MASYDDAGGSSGLEPEDIDMDSMRRRARIQLSSFCVFRDEALLAAHKAKQKEAQRERNEERARALAAAELAGPSVAAAVSEAFPDVQVELPMDPRCQLIVAASGRHLHRFGKGGSVSRHMAHDDPVLAARFNASSLTIFTCTSKQVKIWCALTGRLLKEYNDLLAVENVGINAGSALLSGGGAAGGGRGGVSGLLITSACLDQRQRKFILGDNAGNVYIFNYNTGSLMHKLSNTASLSREGLAGSSSKSKRARSALAATTGSETPATARNSHALVPYRHGRAADSNGCEVLNLHCVLNVSNQSTGSDSALSSALVLSSGADPESDHSGSKNSSNISIHFVHSVGRFIHIHVDDPDHMVGAEGSVRAATTSITTAANASKGKERHAGAGSGAGNGASGPEGRASLAPAKTVLHSLSSHKAELSAIVISESFGLVWSSSADGSLVAYPAFLGGSALQRITP